MYRLNNFFRIHYRNHVAAFDDEIEILIAERTFGYDYPTRKTVESDLRDLIPKNFPFAKKLEVLTSDALFIEFYYRENSCEPKY